MADVKNPVEINHEYPLGIAQAQDRRRIFIIAKGSGSNLESMYNKVKEDTGQLIEQIAAQGKSLYDGLIDNTKGSSASAKLGNSIFKTNVVPVSSPREAWKEHRKPRGETAYAVCLPFPNSFADSQSQQWEETGSISAEVLGNVLDKKVGGLSLNKIFGSAANSVGLRRPVLNPGFFQNYKGPQTRSFSFDWEFIPQSREESEQIQKILYNLRMFTLPRSSAGLVYFAPYTFEIYIENPFIGSITRMEDVVCDKMDITWASEAQQYQDGTPKAVKLSLSFKENTTLTANDFG